ncbi:MAG: HAD family hydrolase [Oenococcus sp.]|uniref:HAD-IIB family hydrolase n=1 Tax=Oenococcus sp. TaxID=1979414 RepID=UPI0039ED410D
MTETGTIRLFASDMDGTLLDSHNHFNQKKMKQVVDLLRQQKKHFVLATGNQAMRINKFFSPFDPQGDVISMVAENGAYIQKGHQRLHQSVINPIKVRRIYDLLQVLDTKPTSAVFAGEGSSFAPDWQESVQNPKTQIFFAGTISDFYPNWQAIDSFDQITIPIDKISLNWKQDSGQQFLDMLENDPLLTGLRTPTSGFGAIDIVNAGADKATGLQRLANDLKIPAGQMAAFGDGLNDLEMLQYVGQPYIMPNSQAELKQYFDKSRLTAADNNHDGVLDTILAILSR